MPTDHSTGTFGCWFFVPTVRIKPEQTGCVHGRRRPAAFLASIFLVDVAAYSIAASTSATVCIALSSGGERQQCCLRSLEGDRVVLGGGLSRSAAACHRALLSKLFRFCFASLAFLDTRNSCIASMRSPQDCAFCCRQILGSPENLDGVLKLDWMQRRKIFSKYVLTLHSSVGSAAIGAAARSGVYTSLELVASICR